jgi:hypothetical protein
MNVRGDGRCVVRKEGAVLGISNEVVKILCKPKLRTLVQLQVLLVLNVSHLWGYGEVTHFDEGVLVKSSVADP